MSLNDKFRSYVDKLVRIKNIYIFNYAGAMRSAVAGIEDLFDIANRFSDEVIFKVSCFSETDADGVEVDEGSVVFVPPCMSVPLPSFKEGYKLKLIQKWQEQGALLVASCVSVFWLAEAGLLDGKLATTHWRMYDQLERDYPGISGVDRQNMVVDQGDVITAAGLYAFQDLVLHLISKFSCFSTAKNVADFSLLDISGRLQTYYQRFNADYSHSDTKVKQAQRLCEDEVIPAETVHITAIAELGLIAEIVDTQDILKLR